MSVSIGTQVTPTCSDAATQTWPWDGMVLDPPDWELALLSSGGSSEDLDEVTDQESIVDDSWMFEDENEKEANEEDKKIEAIENGLLDCLFEF